MIIGSDNNIIIGGAVSNNNTVNDGVLITEESSIIQQNESDYVDDSNDIIKDCLIKSNVLNWEEYYNKFQINKLFEEKQDVLDLDLTTNSKTIVDAINELQILVQKASPENFKIGSSKILYIDGLSIQKDQPINELDILYTISTHPITNVFTLEINEPTDIYRRDLFNTLLYFTNLSVSSKYTIKSELKFGDMLISEGSFILSPNNISEMCSVLMNVNYLLADLTLLNGDSLNLYITLSKDTTFNENLVLKSGGDSSSRFIINNMQLTAHNILDYKQSTTYTQNELNESLFWEKF